MTSGPADPTPPRSFLYVPGDRPERFVKAVASGADGVILDLEDGVAPAAKAEARRNVAVVLDSRVDGAPGPAVVVRVDPRTLPADVGVAIRGRADGIVLAKATTATLAEVDDILGSAGVEAGAMGITALIESAQGLLDAPDMGRHPRTIAFAAGEADLTAELGLRVDPDGPELAALRMTIVVAGSAAGLRPPTAPVSVDFRDLDAFRTSCELLRRQGFGSRSAIHPAQVPVINAAFVPTDEEIAAARAAVASFDAEVAAGRGVAVTADGTMVDEAVVRAARRLLDSI